MTAAARLAPHASRFTLYHRSYSRLGEIFQETGAPAAAGILLDLGLSLYQLKSSGRGFSFQGDEPLDMRFNPEEGRSAADILNNSSPDTLARIFKDYGEEPRSRRYARLVVEARRQNPFRFTQQLVKVVEQAQGPGRRQGERHHATRVFQALRIAVNRELEELALFLEEAPAWLEPGGRLAVISYHSLEDRLVKQSVQAWERAGLMRRITRKPQTPAAGEVARNPRARSAKLRVAEKMG